MSEGKHGKHHGEGDLEHAHHDDLSYWRRFHRDWRFWVGFVLMLIAIGYYVFSVDLSLARGPRTQTTAPATTTR